MELPRIARGRHLVSERAEGVLSLLYAAGERPTADDVARLLDEPVDGGGQGARISHRPDESEGWVELLASGLTFDLSGLAPAPAKRPAPSAHVFGLSADVNGPALEAVLLTPGEHTVPGAAMLPIVRVMCGLGARLASLGSVKAICWNPARSWMEPAYFKRIVASWLGGGAFPALGLAALSRTPDGALQSYGLAFFTGQEMRVDALPGEPPAATAKLAIRMMDLIVRQGRVRESFYVPGPDGKLLHAEPSPGGEIVLVRRGE
ncbi:MAG: hypothetical protein ABWZ75_13290 [Novosphingobium sp.]